MGRRNKLGLYGAYFCGMAGIGAAATLLVVVMVPETLAACATATSSGDHGK